MIPWLDDSGAFPPVESALRRPNGLLAAGGDLSSERLLRAYRMGIFPWYSEGEPILWWSPHPRLVLFPERLVVSRSMRKLLRRGAFNFSFDACFDAVVEACSRPRAYADATWISPEIKQAFGRLHRLGNAHSFEVWSGAELVGGLYGLALGRVFFGESMFHRASNASKAALVFAVDRLEAWGYRLIDCQVYSSHLVSLGAEEIPRSELVRLLDDYCEQGPAAAAWLKEGIKR